MTTWLNSALERASNPITVNVSHLGLDVETLEVKTLSALEFQTLKKDPSIQGLSISDKQEMVGLKTIYEMLAKCDDTLKWGEFQKLPLQLLSELASVVTETVGEANGDGVLGN